MVKPAILDESSKKNAQRFFEIEDNCYEMFFKIGIIELPFGKIDLIIVTQTGNEVSELEMQLISKRCADYARSLPCENNPRHSSSCTSASTIDSHTATRRAITETIGNDELETYTTELAKCYLNHFMVMLDDCLRRFGPNGPLNVFFKCIGSKSSTFTDCMHRCLENLNKFKHAFNFSELDANKVWVDHCITTTVKNETSPVSCICLFFFHNFIGCNFLEWIAFIKRIVY